MISPATTIKTLLLCCAVLLVAAAPAAAQRDHLSGEEADLIREAQAIDKRMEVFGRAMERRALVLTDPQAASSKQVQKEAEKWGPLPAGSRYELFSDVAKILDEAITNIDDFSNRSPDNELLPKALRKLADAATRLLAQLEPLRSTSRGPEIAALDKITEQAQTILDAAKKLPPPAKK